MEVHGRPLFEYSLDAIGASRVDDVVLVVPPGLERSEAVADTNGVSAIVAGGSSRRESVRLGIGAVALGASIVVVHDAARPFASAALFDRIVEALKRTAAEGVRGVVPVVTSPDTLKRVSGSRVVETLARDSVMLVQTPQAFDSRALAEAHERAEATGLEATDDARLLEAAAYSVGVVEGEPGNFKVTTEDDLRRAEEILGRAR